MQQSSLDISQTVAWYMLEGMMLLPNHPASIF
jgi:hypothetical protein